MPTGDEGAVEPTVSAATSAPTSSPFGRSSADGESSGQDVSFGRVRRRSVERAAAPHPTRRWIVPALAAAAVVIAAVVVVATRDGSSKQSVTPAASTAPSAVRPSTTAGSERGSIITVATGTSAGTASAAPSTAPLPVGPIEPSAAGVGMFVLDYTDDSLVSRTDLVTGDVTLVPIVKDLGIPNSAIGIVGGGPTAQVYSSDDVGGADVAACDDGTVWLASASLGAMTLTHTSVHPGAAGDVIAAVQLPAAVQLEPSEIAGTTANCLPVFTGPDGRGYVIEMTGAVMRLDEGLLVAVQHGFSAVETCTGSGRCALVLNGAGSSIVTVPAGGPFSQVAFNHTGTMALVVASGDRGAFAYVHGAVQLVDMATGEISTLTQPPGSAVDPSSVGGTGPDAGAPAAAIVNPIRSARFGQWAQWVPDDTIAIVSTGDQLFRVDVSTKTATAFATTTGFARGAEILGVA